MLFKKWWHFFLKVSKTCVLIPNIESSAVKANCSSSHGVLHTRKTPFNCRMLWPCLPPPVKTLNQPYGPNDPLPLSPSISAPVQLFNNFGSGCWISDVTRDERWAGIRFALDGQLNTGLHSVEITETCVGAKDVSLELLKWTVIYVTTH